MEVNVVAGLVVAAAGVVGFFIWLPIARHRVHRAQVVDEVGPETMELRAETPAVVNLLVNELHSTSDAVAATLLDLAARGHLDIIELSPEQNLVVPKRDPRDALTPYEERLLQVVEQAAAGGPHATVPAIADALGRDSAGTWHRFAYEVRHDARRCGLTTNAATGSETKVLMLLALLPCAGVLIIAPLAYGVVPFLYVGLLLGGIFSFVMGRSTVLTAKGREAAVAWAGTRRFIEHHGELGDLPPAAVELWDRYLAYGAAFGLSGLAVHGLVVELRTTMSLGDVGATFTAIRKAIRVQRDPVQRREWRGEQLRLRFGPAADPDAIYGPGQGTFWELLDRTGQTWPLAAMTMRTDPAIWGRATMARIDALAASAPAELAPDVGVVAGAARHATTVLQRQPADAMASLATDPELCAPEVRQALDRLTAAVATHLGVEPTGDAVVAALVGTPLNLEGPR